MLKLIILLSALILSIIYHNDIMMFGVKMRFGFIISMISTYVIHFTLIFLIYLTIDKKVLANSKSIIKKAVGASVMIISVLIIFKLYPIYKDDYVNTYEKVFIDDIYKTSIEDGLNMVVIHGCPFCTFRAEEIKSMKDIYPDVPMNVLIINRDTLAYEAYHKILGDAVNIEFISSELVDLMEINRFPYLFHKDSEANSSLMKWKNIDFNGAAWDYITKQN